MSNNFRAVESLKPVLKSLRPENEKTHRLRLGDPNILSERVVVRVKTLKRPTGQDTTS